MKSIRIITILIIVTILLTGCDAFRDMTPAAQQNVADTQTATENILANQKTPTDINFSLERYNLIKRAYWVNGQRQKADAVPCNVERPIGYVTLIAGNTILCEYTVDGKISSLNSYLSADSEYYEKNGASGSYYNRWLADVDGSYGTNVDGIFWFDCNGCYHEWNGTYLYSDIPLHVDHPVVQIGGEVDES